MIAPGRAARDLDIEQPFLYPVQPDHLAHHQLHGGAVHRHRHADFTQGPLHAVQMRLLVDRAAIDDGRDFIDAVAQLQRAVLDMHPGPAVRNIAAVDIGDASRRRARGIPSNHCELTRMSWRAWASSGWLGQAPPWWREKQRLTR